MATMDTKKYRNISLKDVSDWQYFHNRLEGSSLYEKDAGDASFERAELLFRIKFFCQDRRLNRDELAALVSTEKHDSWLTIRGKEAILELEKEKMEKFFIDEKPLLRRDMTSKDLLSWKHEASSPQFLLTWFLHSKYFTKEDIRKINLLEEKLSANEITPDEWKAKAIEDGFSEEKIKNIEEYKGKLSAFTESEISSVTRHAAGHFAHKHGLSPDIFQDMVRYNENVLKSRPS